MLKTVSIVKHQLVAWRQTLWRYGEDLVAAKLSEDGWQILERNWRAGRYGEIDIIARDPKGLIVFLEIKTRLSELEPGIRMHGFEAVGYKKQKKMLSIAPRYLVQTRQSQSNYRFDVVVVTFHADDMLQAIIYGEFDTMLKHCHPSIVHIKQAFQ